MILAQWLLASLSSTTTSSAVRSRDVFSWVFRMEKLLKFEPSKSPFTTSSFHSCWAKTGLLANNKPVKSNKNCFHHVCCFYNVSKWYWFWKAQKKKTWAITSLTLSEVSANSLQSLTSKSPRLRVSILAFTLDCFFILPKFQKARIKRTLQFLYVLMSLLCHGHLSFKWVRHYLITTL